MNRILLVLSVWAIHLFGIGAASTQPLQDAPRPQARQVSEEAKIYQAVKPGVVTVETDFGHGSGFVVDPRGLILTNQHVTNGTHWAAIRFDRGLRFNAQVVEQDKTADVAVLCFNPQANPKFKVIPLADPSQGPIAVEGEKVIAIGSPLHQEKVMTLGIVSKVETGVLISDVNINHGNSGGPLLNLAGEAIGINTFGDDIGAKGGPGISGIVSIEKAIPVLERAKQKFASLTLPSSELLPDISTNPITPEMLTEAAKKEKKPFLIKQPHNFETLIETPFIKAWKQAKQEEEVTRDQQRRMKKSKHGEDFDNLQSPRHFWERYAINDYDPVVEVIVRPSLKEAAGSSLGRIFGAAVGVRTRAKLEFRTDFYDMELYRGGTLVQPVRRGRYRVDELYQDENVEVKDVAYGGVYFYDPSAFDPSLPIELKIRRSESLDKWDTVKLDPKVIKQVWNQFAAYHGELPAVNLKE